MLKERKRKKKKQWKSHLLNPLFNSIAEPSWFRTVAIWLPLASPKHHPLCNSMMMELPSFGGEDGKEGEC